MPLTRTISKILRLTGKLPQQTQSYSYHLNIYLCTKAASVLANFQLICITPETQKDASMRKQYDNRCE